MFLLSDRGRLRGSPQRISRRGSTLSRGFLAFEEGRLLISTVRCPGQRGKKEARRARCTPGEFEALGLPLPLGEHTRDQPGAVAEALVLDAHGVHQGQQEVAEGSVLVKAMVLAVLQAEGVAAGDEQGVVARVVGG